MKDRISKVPMEFWLGQIVVVISTVAGVFLAATVGFEKAVDLTLFASDRNTYYLSASFDAELDTNTDRILAYLDEHEEDRFMPENKPIRPLNLFVFDTMKFAESTFELPPEALNGVSEYYAEAASLIDQLNARSLNKQSGFQLLRRMTEQVRQSESVLISQFVLGLRARLTAQGIAL